MTYETARRERNGLSNAPFEIQPAKPQRDGISGGELDWSSETIAS